MKRKILILGGAGFIGKKLQTALSADNVWVLDNLDKQVHGEIKNYQPESEGIRFIKGSFGDHSVLKKLPTDFDVIIFLASSTGTAQSMYESAHYIKNNVAEMAAFLDFWSSNGNQSAHMILASSRAVYGHGMHLQNGVRTQTQPRSITDLRHGKWEALDLQGTLLPQSENDPRGPTSIYGYTKVWQEDLLLNLAASLNIKYTILRFQNVYGPGQSLSNPYTGVLGIFATLASQSKPIDLYEDGKMLRDFVYVQNVVDVLGKAIDNPLFYQNIVNVGSGVPITIADAAIEIKTQLNSQSEIKISGKVRVGDVRHAYADLTLLNRLYFEYVPTSFKVGISTYLSWFLQQKNNGALLGKALNAEQTLMSRKMLFIAGEDPAGD